MDFYKKLTDIAEAIRATRFGVAAVVVVGVFAAAGVLMSANGLVGGSVAQLFGGADQTATTWLADQQGFRNYSGKMSPYTCTTDGTSSNYCQNSRTRAMMLSIHVPGVANGRTSTLQCTSGMSCIYGEGVGSVPFFIGVGQQITIEWDTMNNQHVGVPNGCDIACGDEHDWYWVDFFDTTCSGNVFTTGGARTGSVTITPSGSGDIVLTCGSDGGDRSITIPLVISNGASITLTPAQTSVASGTAIDLTYFATGGTNFSSCYLAGGVFGAAPGTAVGTAGMANTGTLTATTTTYTYSCYDDFFGWVTAESQIDVPKTVLSASLSSVDYGTPTQLIWESSGVIDSTCVVTNNRTATQYLGGTQESPGITTENLTQPTTYKLTCNAQPSPRDVYLTTVSSGAWEWSYSTNAKAAAASLKEYNGQLYAGMGMFTGDGDLMRCNPAATYGSYKCDDTDWTIIWEPGQERLLSMEVFNNKLYIGQGNGASDGDVLVYDGSTFGTARAGAQEEIPSMAVYNGKLYVGQGNGTGDGDVFAFDGTTWTTADDSVSAETVSSMVVFNGNLYVGRGSSAGDGDVRMYNGSTWATSYDGAQEEIKSLAVYNGKLYAGQGTSNGDGDIYVCTPATSGSATVCETGDWALSVDGGGYNSIYSMAVYGGKLYAGTGSDGGEGDVLAFDGNSWATAYNPGGCCESIRALAEFEGNLYAGQGHSTAGYGDIYMLNSSMWLVPEDWNSSNNTIEVIGGGGGGGASGSWGGSAGGGGAYSKITNLALTPGSLVGYQIGAGGSGGSAGNNNAVDGGDTWFSSAGTILAKGGARGIRKSNTVNTAGGLGGAAASGVGSVKYSGGNGGDAYGAEGAGAGGGSAAGKDGPGAWGGSTALGGGGGSGAGANNGQAGISSVGGSGVGGKGGNSGTGGAGGTAGVAGAAGGGGGGASVGATPGVGGYGVEWDGLHGAGGGGGGGAGVSGGSAGVQGGLYGGGGGSGGIASSARDGGDGAQGVIKISYSPTAMVASTTLLIGINIPTVTITALDSIAHENPLGTGTFRLTRTGNTAFAQLVDLVATGGTAVAGDYTASPSSMLVEIPVGSLTQDIVITPVNDGAPEPLETLRYALVASSTYNNGVPAAAVIEMSDQPPGVIIDPDGAGGSEGLSLTCAVGQPVNKTCRVQRGSNATLTWATLYMLSCTVRDQNNNLVSSVTNGSGVTIGPVMQQTIYTLSCTDTRGTVHTAQATIGIVPVIIEPRL